MNWYDTVSKQLHIQSGNSMPHQTIYSSRYTKTVLHTRVL